MMIMKNQRLIGIVLIVALLLLIPFIAMQLTNEVNWTLSDFIIMAILLLSTGLLCELVMRKVKSNQSRLLICGTVLLAFLIIWAELAVGLFGSPLAGS
jgi:Kef-type K+ transport system membrane component KefB